MDVSWLINQGLVLIEANRVALTFGVILTFVYLTLRKNGLLARIAKAIEISLLTNWRLTLLATTGLVLSLASGWTTWDGMWNFTCPEATTGTNKFDTCFSGGVLALMVTFGIQGIMLIIAWLIGESFATGMSQSIPKAQGRKGDYLLGAAQPFLGAIVGILLSVALFVIGMQKFSGGDAAIQGASGWASVGDKLLFAAVGLLVVATLVLNAGSDLIDPYVRSLRVMIKNAALWVMFLACMGTSVFFSFDSLFSTIFPQRERERAAELRAQNQVAGIVSDIGDVALKSRLNLADKFFESEGWKTYDGQLASLAKAAGEAKGEISAYFVQQMEAKRAGIAQQQERIATAQSGRAGLAGKKLSLTEELSRLKGDRPAVAAEYAQHKSELDAKAKDIDAKRVEVLAEEKGVEGSLKVGRGPLYRQRGEELARLQDEYKIKEERTKGAQKRLGDMESRIAQIERQLSAVDGDLAKFEGEAATAEQRIKIAQDTKAGEENPRVDPERVLPAFERARNDFRQDPRVERLSEVQSMCTQLLGAMHETPKTRERVSSIDCDPKAASEAASRVFALNAGLVIFQEQCSGGIHLPKTGGADALFGFARKCAQDVQLPSSETDQLRTKINFIELNRDDKAHRFVVTWNAFQDGNRLAYLALAIAIAMDGLVFMSGLYGANAVRSPLQDVPTSKGRTARELESIVEMALLPDTYDNAQAVLHAMHPVTDVPGFMAEVRLHQIDSHSVATVKRVLNAATSIHAVEQDPNDFDRLLVRPELFEFLSTTARKAFDADKSLLALADLEKMVTVALLPDVGHNAEVVLSYIHPMKEDRGFMGEVKLAEVAKPDMRPVRSALNAGATQDKVQRKSGSQDEYFIHTDMYRTLARIRGRLLSSSASLGAGQGRAALGGDLTERGQALPKDTWQPIDQGQTRGQIGHDPRNVGEEGRGEARPSDRSLGRPNGRIERPILRFQPPHADADVATLNPHGPRPDSLAQQLLDEMLGAIDVRRNEYDLVNDPGLSEAAFNAAKPVQALCEGDTRFGKRVRQRQSQMATKLERAYSAIRTELEADGTAVATLENVHRDILDCLPALMLAPGGAVEEVLDDLISQLEDAARPDAGLPKPDHQLQMRLKQMRDELAPQPRDTQASWDQVGNILFQYEERPLDLPAAFGRIGQA